MNTLGEAGAVFMGFGMILLIKDDTAKAYSHCNISTMAHRYLSVQSCMSALHRLTLCLNIVHKVLVL